MLIRLFYDCLGCVSFLLCTFCWSRANYGHRLGNLSLGHWHCCVLYNRFAVLDLDRYYGLSFWNQFYVHSLCLFAAEYVFPLHLDWYGGWGEGRVMIKGEGGGGGVGWGCLSYIRYFCVYECKCVIFLLICLWTLLGAFSIFLYEVTNFSESSTGRSIAASKASFGTTIVICSLLSFIFWCASLAFSCVCFRPNKEDLLRNNDDDDGAEESFAMRRMGTALPANRKTRPHDTTRFDVSNSKLADGDDDGEEEVIFMQDQRRLL